MGTETTAAIPAQARERGAAAAGKRLRVKAPLGRKPDPARRRRPGLERMPRAAFCSSATPSPRRAALPRPGPALPGGAAASLTRVLRVRGRGDRCTGGLRRTCAWQDKMEMWHIGASPHRISKRIKPMYRYLSYRERWMSA